MADIHDQNKILVGDAVDLFERLEEYYEFEDAVKWFGLPQPLLGGKTPIELIAEGKATELHRLWDNLDAGAYL